MRPNAAIDPPPPEAAALKLAAAVASSDGLTRRFLLALPDAVRIETVLMHYRSAASLAAPPTRSTDRHTACLSTQAGCAMGCVFCATGQQGFIRHLTAGEIVGQVDFVQRLLAPDQSRVRNLVLMGMGEPLHNYDAVMAALGVLCDPRGYGLAPRHVTISTVGWVPGIVRLAAERRPYRLAVSLHGASDEQRNRLVPLGRRWPLGELIEACRSYTARMRRKVLFEWTLIAGENDREDDADRLGALLSGLPAQVNVIPLNRTPGYAGDPSSAVAIARFRERLKLHGVPSSVRQRRGLDVAAGCGQLAGATRPALESL